MGMNIITGNAKTDDCRNCGCHGWFKEAEPWRYVCDACGTGYMMDKCLGCGENASIWDDGPIADGRGKCALCGKVQDVYVTIAVGGGEKARLTLKEWFTLENSVLGVFDAIANADKKVTQLELRTLSAVLEALKEQMDDQLVKDLSGNVLNDFKRVYARYGADPRNIREMIEDSVDIMNARVPKANAIAYREAMKFLGAHIAKAEGVTPEEETMWGHIASTLDDGIQ